MTNIEWTILQELCVVAQGNHCSTTGGVFDELDDELEVLADIEVELDA